MVLLLWIILYGLLFYSAGLLSNHIHVENSITALVIFIYTIALSIYSRKSRCKDMSFPFKMKLCWMDVLYFLPLLVFPISNIFLIKFTFDAHFILLTLGVCVVEEIFFRGFLLKFLYKRWGSIGIICQAIIFALIHFVNLFNGVDIIFVISQVVSAFCVGICFGGVVIKYCSLLPSILAHIAINITGSSGIIIASSAVYWLIIAMCCIVNVVYGAFLIYKHKDKNMER